MTTQTGKLASETITITKAVRMRATKKVHDVTTLNIAHPQAAHIDFNEIALALARTARFSGLGANTISVACHSRIVCEEVMRALDARRDEFTEVEYWEISLVGLLHDCHEAFIGDMTRPVQHYFAGHCAGFTQARDRLTQQLDAAIFEKAGISELKPAARELVASIDDRVGAVEAVLNKIVNGNDVTMTDRMLMLRIEREQTAPLHEDAQRFHDMAAQLIAALAATRSCHVRKLPRSRRTGPLCRHPRGRGQ